ncbi:hemin uptake protein HemP [Jannaschia marina]|uniref:hemin uptake protein HemP n=1 Tax=Jannaschia marina TaxID=2741674 RepID=UPI0015C71627|nr:hemin uptake protein HemP [Jannaschia marina]
MLQTTDTPPAERDNRPAREAAENLPTYAARDLTRNGDLARIVLRDQAYTLRITRAGKLILTK